MIFCDVAGPIPGSFSSSSLLAELMSIFAELLAAFRVIVVQSSGGAALNIFNTQTLLAEADVTSPPGMPFTPQDECVRDRETQPAGTKKKRPAGSECRWKCKEGSERLGSQTRTCVAFGHQHPLLWKRCSLRA